ncbi:MAG: membrane-bound lytic murein transglycosylase MltF [Pseudomonadota bacterium]
MKQTALGLASLMAIGLLAGCENTDAEIGAEAGPLKVAVRNAPGLYYIDRDEQLAGLDYDMTMAFAETLGRPVEFVEAESTAGVLELLVRDEAHFAAAGLTRTGDRSDAFLPSPSYQTVSQQVVCRRDGASPDSVEELAGLKLVVVEGSSYAAELTRLKEEHPDLTWKVENTSSERLLGHVWQREIDCTVADSTIVALNRRIMPELQVQFDLTKPEPLVWYFAKSSSALESLAEDWMESEQGENLIGNLVSRYYGFASVFDYVDTARFVRRIDQRYKRYEPMFSNAAKRYDIDESLLAAQAYQESHWDPVAKSPTGVRGMMMLTLNTAQSLGVENRLDPRQSIEGGARYLKKMKARFDENIPEPDRTWLALAAYNVGRAHMHDAQILARELGKDPKRWASIKDVLPLLSDPNYYKDLKYGYARGMEPVQYVERIRNYQYILKHEMAQ